MCAVFLNRACVRACPEPKVTHIYISPLVALFNMVAVKQPAAQDIKPTTIKSRQPLEREKFCQLI